MSLILILVLTIARGFVSEICYAEMSKKHSIDFFKLKKLPDFYTAVARKIFIRLKNFENKTYRKCRAF